MERYKVLAQQRSAQMRKTDNSLREHRDKLEGLGDRVKEPRKELEKLKEKETTRKRKIEAYRREIKVRKERRDKERGREWPDFLLCLLQGFQDQLEELESPETLNPKIAEKNAAIRHINQEHEEISEKQGQILGQKREIDDIIR